MLQILDRVVKDENGSKGPTKKAEFNRGNNDGKHKYKNYLKQTKATRLKNRLDIRDEEGREQFWGLTE